MPRGFCLYIFILLSLTLTSSCKQTRYWEYSANEYKNLNKKNKSKTVSVVLFKKDLKDAGVSTSDDLATVIPFLPYAKFHVSDPGEGGLSFHHSRPIGDCIAQVSSDEKMTFKSQISFSYALVKDLKSSGMFKKVFYVCKDTLLNTDFIITGSILDVSFDEKKYTYGLGFLWPIPIIFGLPRNTITSNLSIKLALIDAKSKEVLFEKTYTHPGIKITNGYNRKSYFSYSDMIALIYKEFTKDISNYFNLN